MPTLFNSRVNLGCDTTVEFLQVWGLFLLWSTTKDCLVHLDYSRSERKRSLKQMLSSFILSCCIHPSFLPCHHKTHKELGPVQEMSSIVRTRKDAKSEFSLNNAVCFCETEGTENRNFQPTTQWYLLTALKVLKNSCGILYVNLSGIHSVLENWLETHQISREKRWALRSEHLPLHFCFNIIFRFGTSLNNRAKLLFL